MTLPEDYDKGKIIFGIRPLLPSLHVDARHVSEATSHGTVSRLVGRLMHVSDTHGYHYDNHVLGVRSSSLSFLGRTLVSSGEMCDDKVKRGVCLMAARLFRCLENIHKHFL